MTKTEIIEELDRRMKDAHENLEVFQNIADKFDKKGDEINASYFGQKMSKYAAVWCALQDVKEMLMNMEE